MIDRYGPWATMIDLGGRAQLSTFWRRRLTMLASASQTSFVLSRSNLLWLGAAALLMMALPTVHFATAGEKDATAAKGDVQTLSMSSVDASPKDGKGTTPQQDESSVTLYGDFVVSESVGPGEGFIRMPVYVYFELQRPTTRKELKITPDQEKKLIEISRASVKWEDEVRRQVRKELEKMNDLSPADRIAKQGNFQKRLTEVSNSDALRKKIETVLTKVQLTQLRAGSIGANGLSRLMYDQPLREKVGIGQQQKKQLDALMKEQQQLQAVRLPTLIDAIERKTLAVITPEQWAKLEGDIAANGGVIPDQRYPGSEMAALLHLDVVQQLGLTLEQQMKVREALAASHKWMSQNAKFIGGNGPEAERLQAELARKMAEMAKKDHEAIARILSKEQSAALTKLAIRRSLVDNLDMTLFSGASTLEGRTGLLRQIKLTPAQWKEMCRLHDEKERVMWQYFREVGEGVLKILSAEQQDKFIDEWSRDYTLNIWTGPTSSKKNGKDGGSTQVVVGTVTVAGPDAKGETKAGERPKRLPRVSAPKIDAKAAGAAAIKLFDANHDGKLSGAELDKCPGLKAAIDKIDPDGTREITAEMIAARIKAWQDSKLARMSLGCKVTHNGVPLAGAEVKFVPERFLGNDMKAAIGKTDANGGAMLSIPATTSGGPPLPSGVAPGFYRVEISKDGEHIPAKYNKETIFGQEVAIDAKGIREGIKFELKY